jgi:hypothetical protein
MKEAVHHEEDRAAKLDYPLFDKALRRAEQWHAAPGELVTLLTRAGFAVDRDAVEIRHAIPRRRHFQMVENCHMPVLSSFSAAEIAEGLRESEIGEKYGVLETLVFTDHFDDITAVKPE